MYAPNALAQLQPSPIRALREAHATPQIPSLATPVARRPSPVRNVWPFSGSWLTERRTQLLRERAGPSTETARVDLHDQIPGSRAKRPRGPFRSQHSRVGSRIARDRLVANPEANSGTIAMKRQASSAINATQMTMMVRDRAGIVEEVTVIA